MDYTKLSLETWNNLDNLGSNSLGYKGPWLSLNNFDKSDLIIFKDELNDYHFVIEAKEIRKNDIQDPGVNGLQVGLVMFKLQNGIVRQFIDLKCNIPSYLAEFTEVVKEIAKIILVNGEMPLVAVNKVINNWLSFWANQRKQVLSEDEQVGLICELIVLKNLCKIHPGKALKTWTGPLGSKYDFNFTNWNIEVKGTRNLRRIHTINGIDQLKPAVNKQLGFISFLLNNSINQNSISLPILIKSIKDEFLLDKPDLIVRLNELLAGIGYSPLHEAIYEQFNVEILESTFYVVDENFPKLTPNMLNEPLNTRISSITYNINLEGFIGKGLNEIYWGNYFY